MDSEQDHSRTGKVVRLTLEDGTRIQLAPDEVAYSEPEGRGTLIHLVSGELVKVAQDNRTVDLRVVAALSTSPVRHELPTQHEPEPSGRVRDESSMSNAARRAGPISLSLRAKRLLLGHSSLPVLMIARASTRLARLRSTG